MMDGTRNSVRWAWISEHDRGFRSFFFSSSNHEHRPNAFPFLPQNPKVMKAFQDLMSGPGGAMGLLSNPGKLQELMADPEVSGKERMRRRILRGRRASICK